MVSKPGSALKSSSAMKPPPSTASLTGQGICHQGSSHHTIRTVSPCILPKLLTKPLVCRVRPWRLSGALFLGSSRQAAALIFLHCCPAPLPWPTQGPLPTLCVSSCSTANTAQQRPKTPTSCVTDNKTEAMKRGDLLIVPFFTPPVASIQGRASSQC